jgi:hypothetical protein
VKLHEKLFQLFVFLIPTQLGLHFWPDWSLIFGIRIDYLSPTIYISQVVLIILFLSFLYTEGTKNISITDLKKAAAWFLILVVLFLLSSGPLVTLSRFWLILSPIGIYSYVKATYSRSYKLVTSPFLLSLCFLAIVSLLQFLLGHSLGGVLYWFGERPLSVSMPGIALVSIAGVDHLRAYATLPHPNALAGTVLVGVLGLFPVFTSKQKLMALVLGFTVIILTFSQTVWLVVLLLPLLFVMVKRTSPRVLWLVVPLLVLFSVSFGLLPHFVKLSLPKEIMERILLANTALRTWVNHVLFGVGLGNGILFSPRTLIQPVHNIFLLIAEETGITGLIVFSLCCIKIFLSEKAHTKLVLLLVLLIGLSDHYFLTLLQPMLMCALVARITLTSPSPEATT